MFSSQGIETSSYLSKLPLIGWEQAMDVQRLMPSELVPLLKSANIDFVLVGAHGISGWLKQARATEDVDFLIRVRDKRRASEKILTKFPELVLEDSPHVVRFKRGEECLVDLMLTRTVFYKRIFGEFLETRVANINIKIPRLEAALAMKFAAMTGHYRKPAKKYYDAGDFASMIQKNGNIDLPLLQELTELLYSGAGIEVAQYVANVRAGKTLSV